MISLDSVMYYHKLANELIPYPTKCPLSKRIGAIVAAIFSLGFALISQNIRGMIFKGRIYHKLDLSFIVEACSRRGHLSQAEQNEYQRIRHDMKYQIKDMFLIKNLKACRRNSTLYLIRIYAEQRFGKAMW